MTLFFVSDAAKKKKKYLGARADRANEVGGPQVLVDNAHVPFPCAATQVSIQCQVLFGKDTDADARPDFAIEEPVPSQVSTKQDRRVF